MTFELICDGCGNVIPEGMNHIEVGKHVFCSDECEFGFVYGYPLYGDF